MALNGIIVGSGRGVRHLDFTRSYPAALEAVGDDRSVMDWLLAAMRQVGCAEVAYIGGYHIEKIIERYPDVRYAYHPEWQRAARSRRSCVCGNGRGATTSSSAATCWSSPRRSDGSWRQGRHRGGMARFCPSEPPRVALALVRATAADRAGQVAEELAHSHPAAPLEDWVASLRTGRRSGGWSSQGKRRGPRPSAVSRLVLGTKAETLERLRPLLRSAIILPQVRFTVDEWQARGDVLIADIQREHGGSLVIVRSSSLSEDGWGSSGAGRFHTALDVRAGDPAALRGAVEDVIASYAGAAASGSNQVFVQRQISDARPAACSSPATRTAARPIT